MGDIKAGVDSPRSLRWEYYHVYIQKGHGDRARSPFLTRCVALAESLSQGLSFAICKMGRGDDHQHGAGEGREMWRGLPETAVWQGDS